MPSEKLRRLGKIGSIVGFGLFIFAIVFYVSLPYGRFKDLMASQLSTFGYDMEAKHAGPSLGLGMTLKEVTLVSPASGTGKPTRILIDKATLSMSLLSYVFGTKSYSVFAAVFGGDVDVNAKIGKNDTAVNTRLSDIDLAELPWVKNAINLPLAGKLDLKLDLGLPKQRPSEAKGSVTWTCTACAVGDGKAKLIIASNPLLAEGLGLPKIRLGDFTGKVAIDKGVGRLQNVQVKSQDLEVSVEGEIHLAQPIAASHVDLYVRFKLSDSLLRSSEKLRTIMDFTAQMGKRPDGFLGFRATGTFQNMSSVQWLKTSPFVNTSAPVKPAPPVRGASSVPPPPPPAAAPPPGAPPPPPAPVPPPPPPQDPPPVPVLAPAPAPALPPPPAPAPPPAPVLPPAPAPVPAPAAAPVPAPTPAPPPVPAPTPASAPPPLPPTAAAPPPPPAAGAPAPPPPRGLSPTAPAPPAIQNDPN
jgi:type II secretion system protein N